MGARRAGRLSLAVTQGGRPRFLAYDKLGRRHLAYEGVVTELERPQLLRMNGAVRRVAALDARRRGRLRFDAATYAAFLQQR